MITKFNMIILNCKQNICVCVCKFRYLFFEKNCIVTDSRQLKKIVYHCYSHEMTTLFIKFYLVLFISLMSCCNIARHYSDFKRQQT